jgi:Holliday junction resolvasome RuvABC endonuclease subunit
LRFVGHDGYGGVVAFMITLGLDPSLSGFGWCIHNGDVAGEARVVAKGRIHTEAKEIIYCRYVFLRNAVGTLLDEHPEIEAVGVESPPFGEQFSEGLYGLFLYVNEAIMTRRKDVVYFDPLRVKLLTKMDPKVRKGTMDKRDIIDAVKQDTGIKQWNNDEADAYIIARSAARFWDLYAGRITEDELTPAELQVFLGEHTFVNGSKAGETVKKGILAKENDRFYRFSRLNGEGQFPQEDKEEKLARI